MFNEKILIFIMISVVLIGGAIFGMNAIESIKEKQNTLEMNKFLFDLKKNVDQTKNNYGRVLMNEYQLPENVYGICITEKNKEYNWTDFIEFEIIKDSIENNVANNIFLLKDNGDVESFFIAHIKKGTNSSNCCREASGETINLKFTGIGNGTYIEFLH